MLGGIGGGAVTNTETVCCSRCGQVGPCLRCGEYRERIAALEAALATVTKERNELAEVVRVWHASKEDPSRCMTFDEFLERLRKGT